MKRTTKIILLSLTLLMVFFLASCGKFKCDMCGKEKSGTQHKETVFGQEITMCDDCYNNYKKGADAISSLLN